MDKIYITTLGCAKNQVDSEIMMGLLLEKGYEKVYAPDEADIIIVNTCGFIEDAKQESINEILEMAEYKKEKAKYLIVSGCLSQRYSNELSQEIPEVDSFIGTTSFENIVQVIDELKTGRKANLITDIDKMLKEDVPREISTTNGLAYLKIAEGCDNHCTYCIIPKLRGKYRSRKEEDILKEAKLLAENGAKELVLIAQDTSKYGIDLYGEKRLPNLLSQLNEISGIQWIRILYSYPEDIDDKYIEAVKKNDKVLPYFDIPIQHGCDSVLKRMNRNTSKSQIENLVKKIREEIQDAVIRTTIIVGFPGETDEDFEELKDFVKEMEFDKLGVFTYSKEENTPAAKLDNQIEEDVKENRRNEIMELQMEISYNRNQKLEGKTLDMIIEGEIEDNLYEARSRRDMQEIDGVVYLTSHKKLQSGDYVKGIITEAMEYDLLGVIEDEYTE